MRVSQILSKVTSNTGRLCGHATSCTWKPVISHTNVGPKWLLSFCVLFFEGLLKTTVAGTLSKYWDFKKKWGQKHTSLSVAHELSKSKCWEADPCVCLILRKKDSKKIIQCLSVYIFNMCYEKHNCSTSNYRSRQWYVPLCVVGGRSCWRDPPDGSAHITAALQLDLQVVEMHVNLRTHTHTHTV